MQVKNSLPFDECFDGICITGSLHETINGANASYYVGRGEYELFVQDSDNEIIKRKVQLGDSNFEYVEVVSGLQPGDKVVVSDMSNYKTKAS